jgi:phospholipid/cholesterol/gamma-HCH transport system ATP-binding protein
VVSVPDSVARPAVPPAGDARKGAVLEVDGVVTRFGRTTIHDGVSFTAGRGEILAIIGGSGTGKSVLLREIIGLLRPTAGTIRLLGTDVWAASAAALTALRTRFGMMFQDGALFSSLTVAENVATPLAEHAAVPPRLLEPLVRLRIAMAGLPPEAGAKMPSELSGGMRKRAAIARALALEPEVLFLDEPTSGLDPITARAFDGLLRVLCDDLGLTVVVVTHDLDTLLGIVDRVIVLARGKVLTDGPVREVMALDDPWVQSYFSVRRMINDEGEVTNGS